MFDSSFASSWTSVQNIHQPMRNFPTPAALRGKVGSGKCRDSQWIADGVYSISHIWSFVTLSGVMKIRSLVRSSVGESARFNFLTHLEISLEQLLIQCLSFDQTAVMFAAHSDSGQYWTLSDPGTLTVNDAGVGTWSVSPNGLHPYLILTENIEETISHLAAAMTH